MPLRFLYITAFIITALLVAGFSATAQTYTIRGAVYDSSRNYPLEAVSVLSSSGKGTVTNADGVYKIEVTEKDSIWFSYLNKPTKKFAVLKIANPLGFDISLQVNVPTLKEVKIRPRNYKQDSVQNRVDYAKIFNYQKPKIKPTMNGMGVGFDLDEIINMFRFKRNRSLASFQRRLLLEEEDKFIAHRFNKALVRRLTLLESPELDSFMLLYRPSHTFTKMAGDYEFLYYIKTAFFRFKKGFRPMPAIKEEDEE
ncbi:MAG: carboxypeptidase-like regulatory domain-containing protein [Chitinophagaceae bacterium]|nr:carboxypeptidase-like regulatory domain-containing protein [Chitinophagaceae bacterium]